MDYFINEIENIISHIHVRHRNTRGNLEKLEIAWKYKPYGLVFTLLVLLNVQSCFQNCMEIRKMFYIS